MQLVEAPRSAGAGATPPRRAVVGDPMLLTKRRADEAGHRPHRARLHAPPCSVLDRGRERYGQGARRPCDPPPGAGWPQRPFLAVNAAALPDTLLESELFGHERGARSPVRRRPGTGSSSRRSGGTVFLDEVASMSPVVPGQAAPGPSGEGRPQARWGSKDRPVEFRLLGGDQPRPRVHDRRDGEFREDLFYRLGVVRIHVPPLRERTRRHRATWRSHFLRRSTPTTEPRGRGRRRPAPVRGQPSMRFEGHAWPGNVRELENAVQRAVIVCAGRRRSNPGTSG